jgi:hypothetical protein
VAANKVLWIVTLDDVDAFVQQAQAVGATKVAIRTRNTNFDESIPAFHDAGIQVLGWRFPPVVHDKAIAQANHVVELMKTGLDGFIVDPEGDASNPGINWDQAGLQGLAQEFCDTIRNPFPDKLFGTTSDHRARRTFPKLPFATFIRNSDKVYPQSYWRMQTNHGPKPVGKGHPRPNYEVGLEAWQEAGAELENIIPIAGEIALATPDEINEYATAASDNNIDELQFYTADADENVPQAVFDAIASV